MSDKNQEILDWIESLGGGYVWEDEIFTIILEGCILTPDEARTIAGLAGVQQIAILGAKTEMSALLPIVRVESLQSLVLSKSLYSEEEIGNLKATRPDLEIQWG
jgi:hypothetical protein